MHYSRKIILLAVILTVTLGIADARSFSVGTTWSFSGIGLSYERQNENGTIFHAETQLELAENFLGRRGCPGASCSATWSSVIGRTESINGNCIVLHAGTGVMAGYCKDLKQNNIPDPLGITFGLQGRIGATIIYDRNINISVCIKPVIGMHLTNNDDNMNMKYYRYGLLRAIMPEIGIRYRF